MNTPSLTNEILGLRENIDEIRRRFPEVIDRAQDLENQFHAAVTALHRGEGTLARCEDVAAKWRTIWETAIWSVLNVRVLL